MNVGEIEEKQYIFDSLDEIDVFNMSINDRQVKSNQRLRSLAVDSTKSWTRPMPLHLSNRMTAMGFSGLDISEPPLPLPTKGPKQMGRSRTSLH